MMKLYLGLDGGGTGCRARAEDTFGRVIGEGQAGPANVMSDPDAAERAIFTAATAALGSHDLGQVTACLGLAGAVHPDIVEHMERAFPFARTKVVTDGVAAVKGALGDSDGIVAAIGTGSVFVAQRAGQQREIGGKGLILGDEGSGAWIGRALLSAALRAQDGFSPVTPLLQDTLQNMNGPEGIIAFAALARPADFAALAPNVTQSHDPAARAIVTRATDDVLAAITILQNGGPLPVVCLGGLAPVFAAAIGNIWPVAPARGTALDGAVALARSMDAH
jgi:glucosamine kinase